MTNSISIIKVISEAAAKGFQVVTNEELIWNINDFIVGVCNDSAAFDSRILPNFYYNYANWTLIIEFID